MFTNIVTILLFVKDINSSKKWYQKFLSLDPVEDLPDFVSFKIGSIFLNLHLSDEKSPTSTGGTVAYWCVEDLQRSIEKAVGLGAKVYRGPGYIKETNRIIVQIMDPFGNVFGMEK